MPGGVNLVALRTWTLLRVWACVHAKKETHSGFDNPSRAPNQPHAKIQLMKHGWNSLVLMSWSTSKACLLSNHPPIPKNSCTCRYLYSEMSTVGRFLLVYVGALHSSKTESFKGLDNPTHTAFKRNTEIFWLPSAKENNHKSLVQSLSHSIASHLRCKKYIISAYTTCSLCCCHVFALAYFVLLLVSYLFCHCFLMLFFSICFLCLFSCSCVHLLLPFWQLFSHFPFRREQQELIA